jgi:hypothetical protein
MQRRSISQADPSIELDCGFSFRRLSIADKGNKCLLFSGALLLVLASCASHMSKELSVRSTLK